MNHKWIHSITFSRCEACNFVVMHDGYSHSEEAPKTCTGIRNNFWGETKNDN